LRLKIWYFASFILVILFFGLKKVSANKPNKKPPGVTRPGRHRGEKNIKKKMKYKNIINTKIGGRGYKIACVLKQTLRAVSVPPKDDPETGGIHPFNEMITYFPLSLTEEKRRLQILKSRSTFSGRSVFFAFLS